MSSAPKTNPVRSKTSPTIATIRPRPAPQNATPIPTAATAPAIHRCGQAASPQSYSTFHLAEKRACQSSAARISMRLIFSYASSRGQAVAYGGRSSGWAPIGHASS